MHKRGFWLGGGGLTATPGRLANLDNAPAPGIQIYGDQQSGKFVEEVDAMLTGLQTSPLDGRARLSRKCLASNYLRAIRLAHAAYKRLTDSFQRGFFIGRQTDHSQVRVSGRWRATLLCLPISLQRCQLTLKMIKRGTLPYADSARLSRLIQSATKPARHRCGASHDGQATAPPDLREGYWLCRGVLKKHG